MAGNSMTGQDRGGGVVESQGFSEAVFSGSWRFPLSFPYAFKFAEDTGRLNVKRDEDQRQEESESDNGDESEDGEED